MKNKLILATLTMLLLSSCGKQEVSFTINWGEVWEFIIHAAIVLIIVIGVILYIFKDFRLF